jgi:hypothetical protein
MSSCAYCIFPACRDDEEGVEELAPWQHNIITQIAGTPRDPSAPTMDSMTAGEQGLSVKCDQCVWVCEIWQADM